MIWNEHSDLKGKHAFLSPSSPAWWNYDDVKLSERYLNRDATTIGTILHDYAKFLIDDKIRLAKSDSKMVATELRRNGIQKECFDIGFIFPNFMAYVNDAITFGLDTEKTLYYTSDCFGTADAIRYADGYLRIHDYKSGTTPAHIEQLLTYAALFCLEYKEKLNLDISKLGCELRIYQYDMSVLFNPEYEDLRNAIDRVVTKSNTLKKLRKERIDIL